MEKRSSGGGAKLCTLDMQSYLEVMGRQLDEIQAQHHQFYASRQDRLGKLRSQEHPGQLVKRWSSESHGATRQPDGLPPEYPPPLGFCHSHGEREQLGSPCIGDSSGALPSSSASQSGARRSLLFTDGRFKASEAGSEHVNTRSPPGNGNMASAANSIGAARGNAQGCSELTVPVRDQPCDAAAQQRSESPPASGSTSVTSSTTPQAASAGFLFNTPGTPSTHPGQSKTGVPSGASPMGTSSSSHSIPCGIPSGSYATPDSHNRGCPLTASASSSSPGAWHQSQVATNPSPSSQGAVVSPSTASVDFYQNAGFRGVASEVELLSEVASESDVSPYPIALPGRPFDGIDSEEDDVVQPAGNSYAGGSTNARCTAQALPDDLVGPRGEQPDDVSDQRVVQQLVMQQQPLPPAACTDSRPQSGASARAPLVVASLETEEALRALLATPRFAMSRSDNVATSIDVEGLEVPAEVLAALAKTDGMDLDAALGAAMAVSLREHPSLPLTPPAKQTQGTAGVGQTGQGRQMVLGPGALTAAPVTVSPGGAVRGFETSKRSAGGASVRAASIAGPMPSVVPPPRDAGHPKQQADRPSAPIDASFEVDRLDMLSQTVEISMEGALSTTDSAVFAALASAQAAVAQQHSQPVLYSLAPKPTLPVDKGSRRNTSDGESRRVTIDAGSRCTLGGGGGSRRNTADGGALIFEFSDAGQMNGKEHPHSRVHSAAPTADPTVTAGVSNAGRPDMRPVGASPSVGGTVSGHGGAGNSSGRAPDGVAAAASPVRGFRGGANVVSPSAASSIMRQGGDGDMVLFGSPSQKGDAGASPSPSTSPYVPPSPPPGADPSPYISSPTVTHMGSRLQRNSRKMDEEAVTGVRHDAEAEHGQLGVDGGVGVSGTGHSLRLLPARGAVQSTSRRQLTQTGVSGTSSGPNSVHLDLSLTQAAAVVAIASARPAATAVQQPTAVATLSPVVSQRQLRMQGLQHHVSLHKQYSDQQVVPAPAEVTPPSTSSLPTEVSPPSRHATGVVSPGTVVEGMGCPAMTFPATRGSTAAKSGLAEPSGHSSDSNQTSRPQLQSLGLQLAAFSRAAALAAAVDVGIAPPPPAVERRPAPPTVLSVNTRSASVEPVASVTPDASATSRESDTGKLNVAGLNVTGDASTAAGLQSRGLGKPARNTYGQGDIAADGRHLYLGHPELVQGQSPGPPSIASSAAKLTQLKARRQQQWQSQHGLQGSQSIPAAASTPPPQQSGSAHKEEQSFNAHYGNRSHQSLSATDRNDGSTSFGRPGAQVAPQPFGNTPASAAVPVVVSRPQLLVAISSAPTQGAVTEARAPLACSKKEATIANVLNLTHENSDVTVANEAGQVKWAWQTDAKGKPGPGRLDTTVAVPPSPSSCNNSSGSPWASPAAASAVVRDSGAEWALQQLPPPQWQRHGQVPAGTHANKLQHERPKQNAEGKPPLPQPQQQSCQYADGRRQSDCMIADRPATDAGADTNPYAISAGGVSAQEQNQLRATSATEGGGQPNSKALALLRLKQQSIMRHNAHVSTINELTGQPKVVDEQEQQGPPLIQQASRGRSNSASMQRQQRQPPRQASASRALYVPEQGDARQHVSKAGVPEVDDVETGDVDGVGFQVQPKPFLRRRSAKVEARKVDWSYVKPRTNSRNPDYYGDQNSPDAVLKARASPLASPGGGVTKPPLNINVGARAKQPGVKLPLTPTEGERTPPGVPTKRRLSNIPPAPGGAPCAGATVEERRGPALGPGRAASGALSPLDDLLAHVNTLLRDFDKIVL